MCRPVGEGCGPRGYLLCDLAVTCRLHASPVAAELFRTGVYTVRGRFTLDSAARRERMLLFRGAVADPLERAISIRGSRPVLTGIHDFRRLFILSGRSARLPRVHKRRAPAVLSHSFLIRLFAFHARYNEQGWCLPACRRHREHDEDRAHR